MTPALSMYSCRLSILWKVENLFPGGHLPKKEKGIVEHSQPPLKTKTDLIVVVDYAFGVQAFELMENLLEPFMAGASQTRFRFSAISIMGTRVIIELDLINDLV